MYIKNSWEHTPSPAVPSITFVQHMLLLCDRKEVETMSEPDPFLDGKNNALEVI